MTAFERIKTESRCFVTCPITLWTKLLRHKSETTTSQPSLRRVGSMDDQPEPIQANTNTPAVPMFDADDLTQIAKFLDALLEADIANKSNERKQGNEGVLSHSSNSNFSLEPIG